MHVAKTQFLYFDRPAVAWLVWSLCTEHGLPSYSYHPGQKLRYQALKKFIHKKKNLVKFIYKCKCPTLLLES